MSDIDRWKQGKPHLRLEPVARTPEQLLDLELAEAFVALEVANGAKRPRRFYKIAEGELHPGRIIGRIVADAHRVGVSPMALLRALVLPIKRLIERKFQRRRLPPVPERKLLSA